MIDLQIAASQSSVIASKHRPGQDSRLRLSGDHVTAVLGGFECCTEVLGNPCATWQQPQQRARERERERRYSSQSNVLTALTAL